MFLTTCSYCCWAHANISTLTFTLLFGKSTNSGTYEHYDLAYGCTNPEKFNYKKEVHICAKMCNIDTEGEFCKYFGLPILFFSR